MNDFPKNKSKKINNLKLPPQSDDAERSVLGGLMLVGEAWDKVADLLSEEDFYRNDHSLIFKAIRALSEENKPCDVITVGEWLDLHQLLEDAGGEDYLIEIASNVPGAANIKAYAEIVREKSVLRQLIQIGNQLTEKAFNPEGKNSDDLLEEAEKDVFGIREQTLKTKSGFQDIKTLLRQVIVNIEEMSTSDGAMTGIPTGFTDFDKKTNGLQKSDLIIVAGRPAMGKTSFAVNIAEKVAIKEGKSVAIFSMEMSSVQLAMRMMASLSRINSSRLKSGQLHDEEWPRIVQVNHLLSNSKIFIDDTPALSPMEVRARCRRLQRQHGLDLVVIDYLQLMQVKGSENRVNEISEISRSLKGLAKELDIPVIALSQLNRSLEQRPNKRPVMSDLRECVTGDTKVVLSDGSRIPIEDLVGTKPKLFALNQKDKIIVAQSDKVWKVGQKKVYKLHLASGRSIKATAEHRFKVDLSWKKVKDIQIGNRLALANHIPEPNKNGKSHAKLLNNNELKQHANNDIFWDKVV
ncbi:MAG TPA: replicative DNA helicase, partial [Oceanospirillales bacterium]|nr:replicative DNA helicase [Oceanospirillales bacterium]